MISTQVSVTVSGSPVIQRCGVHDEIIMQQVAQHLIYMTVTNTQPSAGSCAVTGDMTVQLCSWNVTVRRTDGCHWVSCGTTMLPCISGWYVSNTIITHRCRRPCTQHNTTLHYPQKTSIKHHHVHLDLLSSDNVAVMIELCK